MRIELSKSIPYKDSELNAIDFDFENLTGRDILAVESEARASGENIAAWEYSRGFLSSIAARASHLPVDVIRGLNVKDFTRIINEVLSFLAGQASEE